MGVVTADQDREIRRHRYVTASSRRIWRITFVACAAVLALGLGLAAFIQQQAADSRERARDRALRQAQSALLDRQKADIACVKRWADDYTQRADRINSLSQPRSDALDRLVESIGNPKAFDHWRRVYLERSALARKNAQDNPLPPSPVFACGLVPETGPVPYTPGPTHPVRVPPAARSSTPPRTAGRSPATPAPSTRRSRPANGDTSSRAAGPVAPTRSSVAPRPGGGSSSRPAPPVPSVVLHLPVPVPVCIILRPIVATC